MYTDVCKLIDHSFLSPTMTVDVLEAGCREAVEFDVASVCIMPYYVSRCAEILRGSSVKASTVIGFPHGGQTTSIKVAESKQAIDDNAVELDMVVNISQVLSGNWDYVRSEIKQIVDLAHSRGAKVKVIFENCYLQDEHKIKLCEICGQLGADWVKTSTGYGTSGATVDDVRLMREHSPAHVQVKAAGGIRDLDTLLAMRELGVTRCGLSKTAEILGQLRTRLGMPPLKATTSSKASNY